MYNLQVTGCCFTCSLTVLGKIGRTYSSEAGIRAQGEAWLQNKTPQSYVKLKNATSALNHLVLKYIGGAQIGEWRNQIPGEKLHWL